MRLITYPLLAGLSVLLLASQAGAQRRPGYGGTLRIDVRQQPGSIEESSPWFASIFETLVRVDDTGRVRPHLAVSWSHDTTRKRWIFVPRSDVRLHGGAIWSPAPDTLSFFDDRPVQDLLLDLARPRTAIMIRQTEGPPLGTGPFRITEWQQGKSLTLMAHESHWAGRPFLDRIEIRFNRSLRDQAVDFELNREDLTEVALTDIRRFRGPQLALSPPSLLLALITSRPIRGLGQAIDRASIHNVLLQKQGEPTGALLPQFLSGIAFLFPATRDPDTARTLAAGTPPLTFHYDRQDPLLRAIAERITLNRQRLVLRFGRPLIRKRTCVSLCSAFRPRTRVPLSKISPAHSTSRRLRRAIRTRRSGICSIYTASSRFFICRPPGVSARDFMGGTPRSRGS